MSLEVQKTKWSQFGVLVIVFFFWGFVAASNDILIPVFKSAFNLNQWQVQLVSVSFYVSYTVGSLIYFLISKLLKKDLLDTIGYKNGIVWGLLLSAAGTLLFYPAAKFESFNLMLSALFIVGLGFALQQIGANPMAIVMGSKQNSSQRLTMAGGVNNLGTIIGPIIVSFAFFGSVNSSSSVASIESVKVPYLILGCFFILVALFFKLSPIPNKIPLDESSVDNKKKEVSICSEKKSALHFPQLVLGMIAIFVYVGVEVSSASNLPAYIQSHLAISTNEIAPFISLYWAGLMIGRWTGAVGTFNIGSNTKKLLRFFMPYIAFGIFLLVNIIANHDVSKFYFYVLFIAVLILADVLSKSNPARMLFIFSIFGIIMTMIGIFSSGIVSVYAFISIGLFCSTLWPCIFTLAISGLGKHTNKGSSFLIMMIMGGGIISVLQGYISEFSVIGVKFSYTVAVICFLYLAFYAFKVKKILKFQGLDLDKIADLEKY